MSVVHCWRCQALLPPRRQSCWRCNADQHARDAEFGNDGQDSAELGLDNSGLGDDGQDSAELGLDNSGLGDDGQGSAELTHEARYPRRRDADGEYCDDPNCSDCADDPDIAYDLVSGEDSAGRPSALLNHPSQIGRGAMDREVAERMHPAASADVIRVGLLPRLLANLLSLIIWWTIVIVGFFLAASLYDSPPVLLAVGLMAVPVIGETFLLAEFGVTPGKYLTGLRVRAGEDRPGLSRSVIRVLVVVAPFVPALYNGLIGDVFLVIGILWVIALMASVATHPDKRGLHDRIAGTSVFARPRVLG